MSLLRVVAVAALGLVCGCGTSKPQTGPDSGTTPDAGGLDAGASDGGSSDSGAPDSGALDAGLRDGGTRDGGGTVDGGGLGPDGGTVSNLYFAVIGDTRPSSQDQTSGYPTAIITKIFQDIEALSPRPDFAISTGDYMFVTPGSTGVGPAAAQTALYLSAQKSFTGQVFPAMGNHECDGSIGGNCDAGSTTPQYLEFMGSFIGPLGYSTPYYSVPIDAADGAWTSKLIVLACNAWDATQLNWATAELSRATTYTFLVVHDPATATTAPCVADVATLVTGNNVTLLINGHTHTYSHQAREVVVGNAGAPLSSTVNYGYVTVQRSPDGGLRVSEYDYATNALNDQFTIP